MSQYMHGSDEAEQARLEQQATMFGGVDFLPQLEPHMHLLELGSGTGAVARLVARRLKEGHVTGVERQPRYVETSRRLASSEALSNVTFIVGDIEKVDIPQDSFDGAYCRYFLEHLEKPEDAVRAMARAVKPGGFVCAYEWENACFTSYPECPAALDLWRAGCHLQDLLGGNGHMGRELGRVFLEAGLTDVDLSSHAFALTAQNRKELVWYAESACQIIDEMREDLRARKLIDEEWIDKARQEYLDLVDHPHAFCIEVMCRAVARV